MHEPEVDFLSPVSTPQSASEKPLLEIGDEIFIDDMVLIDDGSSCNIMYIGIFMKLGLHDRVLIPYEGKNLMTLNDYITYPCGAVEFPVST